jgi:hypothetical protein
VSGDALGASKREARRRGLSLEEYLARIAGGEKWCTGCKEWHLRSAFTLDNSRSGRLTPECVTFRKRRYQTKRRQEAMIPLSPTQIAQFRAADPEYQERAA